MWAYKIIEVKMPYDFMEISVEYTAPNDNTFVKNYSFTVAKTSEEIQLFINEEINKVEALRLSYEALMGIVGQQIPYTG